MKPTNSMLITPPGKRSRSALLGACPRHQLAVQLNTNKNTPPTAFRHSAFPPIEQVIEAKD